MTDAIDNLEFDPIKGDEGVDLAYVISDDATGVVVARGTVQKSCSAHLTAPEGCTVHFGEFSGSCLVVDGCAVDLPDIEPTINASSGVIAISGVPVGSGVYLNGMPVGFEEIELGDESCVRMERVYSCRFDETVGGSLRIIGPGHKDYSRAISACPVESRKRQVLEQLNSLDTRAVRAVANILHQIVTRSPSMKKFVDGGDLDVLGEIVGAAASARQELSLLKRPSSPVDNS